MTFRKDLNGLRAIAVTAVLVFHFLPEWLPGGFAGVDVFFVISGYLMTSIIFRGLANNNFSIIKFYVARANRIIPALAVMCLVLLVLGWIYLLPDNFFVFGKHAAGSAGFISNIIYLRESGYFDAAARSKWLLHTWSLSIEWQFYMLYPVALVVMRSCMTVAAVKRVVFIAAVAGFLYCIAETGRSADSAFYLLPSRVWELLFGGIAYLYPINNLRHSHRKYLALIGLLLIVGTFVFVSEEDLWPGYLALVPVFGTYCMILANRAGSVVTSNPVSQQLGLWSYSIYLWHWPLVVAIYYMQLSGIWNIIGIPVAIALGFVSYRCVEQIRFKRDFDTVLSYARCVPVYLVLLVVLLGSLAHLTKGARFRLDETTGNEFQLARNLYFPSSIRKWIPERFLPYDSCVDADCPVGAILVGDSHAGMQKSALNRYFAGKKRVIDWSKGGCKTIRGVYWHKKSRTGVDCVRHVDYMLREIKKYPDKPVLIANRYIPVLYSDSSIKIDADINEPEFQLSREESEKAFEYDENNIRNEALAEKIALIVLKKTVCRFAETNPVYIYQPIPEFGYPVLEEMQKMRIMGDKNIRTKIPLAQFLSTNKKIFELLDDLENDCNVQIIKTYKKFCDDSDCHNNVNGVSLYVDNTHLTGYGTTFLIPEYRKLNLSGSHDRQ